MCNICFALVIENEVVDQFAEHFVHSFVDKSEPVKRERRRREREVAKVGEQIAAKVLNTNENGAWILGNVLDYDPGRDMYDIQDEDDNSKYYTLSSREVKRLEDVTSQYRKGDGVLCVFPETTSFYRAIVAKNPKAPLHGNSSCMLVLSRRLICQVILYIVYLGVGDLVVRFEDDEDESGVAPPRRVPGRFVLRRSDVEEDEED
jgi:hypothetical protein